MIPTKEQIEASFQSLADPQTASEINREAKEMFALAEKSEHFRAVVTEFVAASLKSLSLGGFLPKGPAMTVCVAYLLGQRSVGQQAAPDPPLSQDFVDKMVKEMEQKWKDENKS